jgi:hypothetical protein
MREETYDCWWEKRMYSVWTAVKIPQRNAFTYTPCTANPK